MDTTTTLRLVPRRGRPGATETRTAPRPRTLNVTVRTDDRILLSVEDAAERLDIGRTMLYELISAGEIHAIHVGRLRKVPVDALACDVFAQRALAGDTATAHDNAG
jgi:excisionase family DNA binding protein